MTYTVEQGDVILLLHSSDLNSSAHNKLYKVVETQDSGYLRIEEAGDLNESNPLAIRPGGRVNRFGINKNSSTFIPIKDKESILKLIDAQVSDLNNKLEDLSILKELASEGVTDDVSAEEYLLNHIEVMKTKERPKKDILRVVKLASDNILFKALKLTCKA